MSDKNVRAPLPRATVGRECRQRGRGLRELSVGDEGGLGEACKAKEPAAIKEGVEGGNKVAALIAGFIDLGGVYRDGFEKYAAGSAKLVKLFRDLMAQVIKDDGLGKVLSKTGV